MTGIRKGNYTWVQSLQEAILFPDGRLVYPELKEPVSFYSIISVYPAVSGALTKNKRVSVQGIIVKALLPADKARQQA